MEQKLSTVIINIYNKIDIYFSKYYKDNSNGSLHINTSQHEFNKHHDIHETKVVNITNYYTDPLPWYMYMLNIQDKPTIINNIYTYPEAKNTNKTNKEDEIKDNKNDYSKVIGISLGVALSFVSTYVLAKDDYISYWLSDIDNDINNLVYLSKDTPYFETSSQIKEAFSDWINMMVKRTKPIFLGKTGCISGSGLIIGGIFLSNPVGIGAGIVGLTGSGCYMLWKKLTHKDLNEKDYFNNLMSYINKFSVKLKENIDMKEIQRNHKSICTPYLPYVSIQHSGVPSYQNIYPTAPYIE